MSAILDALNNRKKEVELSSEKVELAIGDELGKLTSLVETSMKSTDRELDSAFTPIRQLEKAIDRLTSEIPSKIETFKKFSQALQQLELQFSKDNDKIRQAESDLGVKIPQPKALSKASSELTKFQAMEETFRKEINEFNTLAKKFKAMR